MSLKKHLVQAGAGLALAGLFVSVNTNEAEAASWQPRTVSEIKAEIENQASGQEGAVEYTFAWGDTLWGISEATGISVNKLAQVNNIENSNLIIVGNSIYLSKDNSVISVEDENKEIKSYDVSEEEVTETETPKEVQEQAAQEESQKEAERQAAEAQAAEQAAQEEQAAEQQAAEEEAAAQAQAEAQEQAAREAAEAEAEAAAQAAEAAQAEEQAQTQQASTSSSQAASSTGARLGTFNSTAYAVGDGLTPSTVTANGTNVANTIYSGGHRIIATDPAVIPTNSVVEVHIPGQAPFTAVAADTGSAINGNKIDLLVGSPSEAISYGVKSGIEIYAVN